MKVYSLSSRANKPCNVITFKKCTLMFDCGLDMSSVMHFLPLPLVPSHKLNSLNSWMPRDADSHLEGELRECINRVFIDSPIEFKPPHNGLVDFSEIDAILVSNYISMLALPYVTNGTGFQGVVLMTEPTLQIGRLFMTELVSYIERTPKARHATRWKNFLRSMPPPLYDVKDSKLWQTAYNMKDVASALSYVQIIAYSEKIDICGALKVTAVSSGFCLGSCNWLICSHHEKIIYLSGSSSLTTHPRPIDQVSLKSADVLILTALNHTPMYNPDSMLGEFCVAIAQTVRNGGNALVPCYPSGVIYDLFECLSNHLDNVNLPFIPMYFVSPVAESSLAYSNIFSEWLSSAKQGKVYQMEDPFPHAHLSRTERLKAFKDLHSEGFSTEYRQPCIVFCGHPSLRFGDAVHFVEMWGNNPMNAILFTEPEFDFIDALAPYQPLSIRPIHCPIDTSLNFTQAKKLINDLKPKKLLIPEVYLKPPLNAAHRTDLVLDMDMQPVTFGANQITHVNLKRHLETANIDLELAETLNPVTVKAGLAATSLSCSLRVQDNQYMLKKLENVGDSVKKEPTSLPFGQINVEECVQLLAQKGFPQAKVEEELGGTIITLENESVVIQMKENSTHIITTDSKVREKIKDILLDCLTLL